MNLKQMIEAKYGSINKFSDTVGKTLLSKQTIYKMIRDEKPNPTLTTLIYLAKYLEINFIDLVLKYKSTHEENQNENTN
jgi:DNA-binding XRE family transcriptional regulator